MRLAEAQIVKLVERGITMLPAVVFESTCCSKCQRKGHLRRMCPGGKASGRPWGAGSAPGPGPGGSAGTGHETDYISGIADRGSNSEECGEDLEQELLHLCLNNYKSVSVSIKIDNTVLHMEIDTGTAISKSEIYEELGCLMWGYRLIVPEGCSRKEQTPLVRRVAEKEKEDKDCFLTPEKELTQPVDTVPNTSTSTPAPTQPRPIRKCRLVNVP
ncbi:hypothetical protein ACJJTC_016240 [Scirpophaga incertulas]